jgi:hypothetical protein
MVLYLWMMAIPPSIFNAAAILLSEIVSMGEAMMGKLSLSFSLRSVEMSMFERLRIFEY